MSLNTELCLIIQGNSGKGSRIFFVDSPTFLSVFRLLSCYWIPLELTAYNHIYCCTLIMWVLFTSYLVIETHMMFTSLSLMQLWFRDFSNWGLVWNMSLHGEYIKLMILSHIAKSSYNEGALIFTPLSHFIYQKWHVTLNR